MREPLAGVRVSDFTVHAAGPFCAHVLSLLGAEVIKIESAVRPDIFRRPHPVYGRMEASKFEQVAANKRSVTLNLKEPRAVELAKRLVSISDLVIESFRPGVMERLGLGYGELSRMKPEIVMLSISAFGQTGPDRSYPGYAPMFAAAGGLGYLTGYSDGPPVEIRHVMDHSVGMTGAFAVLAALSKRRRDRFGQHVDLAARDVASALIGDALVAATFGETPARRGNASESMAPHNVYPCRGTDSWLSIAVSEDAQWRALARAMGRAELGEDRRFRTRDDRLKNLTALDEIVAAWTVGREADDAARELQALGVSAVPSWNAAQLANDVHLRARGTIVDLDVGGVPRAVVGSLARFSKSSCGLRSGTPALGQDNDHVFGELLGISPDERRMLERERVIY